MSAAPPCTALHFSRFRDVNFTRAAAVGGSGDDVLSGGWLTGRLLIQMFSVGLRRVLSDVLLRLQFGLALRDHVVRLPSEGFKQKNETKPDVV